MPSFQSSWHTNRVKDHITTYLNYLRTLNRAQSTIDWYNTLLHRFIDFATGKGADNIHEITPAMIFDYQKHVASSLNERGRAYSVCSQNLHLRVLEHFFKHLRHAGYIPHNPTSDLEYAREPERLPKAVPSIKEVAKVMNVPDTKTVLGYRDRTILEILYSTGIRRQELVNLRLQDIDLDSGILMVRQGKGRKDRAVPLGRVAARYLETYLQGIRPELIREPTDFVFLSIRSRPLSKHWLTVMVRRYGRRARISVDITPHSFRHACATHMIRNRANIRHVQEMLGHKKLETTEKYLQLTITDLKEAHHKFHPRERDR